MAVLLSSECGRLGGDVLKRLVVYEATYAKTFQELTSPPAPTFSVVPGHI